MSVDDLKKREVPSGLELYFSNKALVKSILTDSAGKVWMTGVKDHEIRWQQGTVAICILLLHTKIISLLELPEEQYYLSGDRGSPARSLDNLLNKPGDWAVQMFGEKGGFASIRSYIYRRKTVTRNNTISELCWDSTQLHPKDIEIYLQGEKCTDWKRLVEVLKNLCEEFSPETGLEQWNTLQNDYATEPNLDSSPETEGDQIDEAQAPVIQAEEAQVESEKAPAHVATNQPSARATGLGTPRQRPGSVKSRRFWWAVGLIVLLTIGGAGLWYANRTPPPPPLPLATDQDEALLVVDQFFDFVNDREYAQAYALTSDRYKKERPLSQFTTFFTNRRYEDLRILGSPDNLNPGKTKRIYHLVSTLVTEARLIPELAGIGQLTVGQMDSYVTRLNLFRENMRKLGVPDARIESMEKKQIESLTLSRYLVDRLEVKDEDLAKIYPTVVKVESTRRKILTLRWDEASNHWKIDDVSDYEEVLAIPR